MTKILQSRAVELSHFAGKHTTYTIVQILKTDQLRGSLYLAVAPKFQPVLFLQPSSHLYFVFTILHCTWLYDFARWRTCYFTMCNLDGYKHTYLHERNVYTGMRRERLWRSEWISLGPDLMSITRKSVLFSENYTWLRLTNKTISGESPMSCTSIEEWHSKKYCT